MFWLSSFVHKIDFLIGEFGDRKWTPNSPIKIAYFIGTEKLEKHMEIAYVFQVFNFGMKGKISQPKHLLN